MKRVSEKDIQRIGTYIDQKYAISISCRKAPMFLKEETLYYKIEVYKTIVDNKKLILDKMVYFKNCNKNFDVVFKEYLRLVKIFTYLQQRNLRLKNRCNNE